MISKSIAAALALALAASPAIAAGKMGGHAKPFGEAAAPEQASRTVTIIMKDNHFEPDRISVKAGETIRFVVRNEGALLHEFALGRPADHRRHGKMMAMMMKHGMITTTRIDQQKMKMDHGAMGMEDHAHGPESGSLLLEPGTSGELTWRFREVANLEFACTVPGHYDVGMAGPIEFRK